MNRTIYGSFDHQLTFLSRPKRHGAWVFITLVAMAASFTYAVSQQRPPLAADTAPPAVAAATTTTAAPATEAPSVQKVEINYVVKPGDTLGKIFSMLKIDVATLPALLDVPAVRERFAALKPGNELTIVLHNGKLHGLTRRLGDTELLSIARGATGGFSARIVNTPTETKTAQVRGTINASLFGAGRAVGLTPEIVQQLANDVFGWQVDFARDIRAGDRFNVVYEQKFRDDAYLGDGHILAAELVSNGETHRAIRYTSADGKIDGYFTPDGHSVRRPLLRAPIDFSRVQAHAGDERQPVITLVQEHDGIDYPAPAGTVVKAAGDGRIKLIGDNGEYGHTVIIEHGNGASTLYAHLSGFSRGLAASQRVKQGDVIGYVGNTGASTAPHLHYEYRLNGKPTDPTAVVAAVGAQIPEPYLADFRAKSAVLLSSLAGQGEAVVTALLAR